MYAEVDVFISNYTLVDADIFQLWTEGYSCEWNCSNCCCSSYMDDFKCNLFLFY